LELWNYRKKDQLLASGKRLLREVAEADIGVKEDGKPGLSYSQRQWLQVQKEQAQDSTPYVDKAGLRAEMARWIYPLHFIDFETAKVAIPFNQGQHPYEQIAFQFSHHIVKHDGTVAHDGQYLHQTRGQFPNYDFVGALMQALANDQGTIFRYATHENAVLNAILDQLSADPQPPHDREALCAFIKSITHSPKGRTPPWQGARDMIDLCAVGKRYFYDPQTHGSNSIKAVLPAVLNSSVYLQKKYGQPIYGTAGGIPSLNYHDWRWIQFADNVVVDPYLLLPKLFQDTSDQNCARLNQADELRDGGGAMTAYARMQFSEMGADERRELSAALLKYCELDTFAMVLLYEGWREMVK